MPIEITITVRNTTEAHIAKEERAYTLDYLLSIPITMGHVQVWNDIMGMVAATQTAIQNIENQPPIG